MKVLDEFCSSTLMKEAYLLCLQFTAGAPMQFPLVLPIVSYQQEDVQFYWWFLFLSVVVRGFEMAPRYHIGYSSLKAETIGGDY